MNTNRVLPFVLALLALGLTGCYKSACRVPEEAVGGRFGPMMGQPTLPKERPIYANQVLNPKELVRGQFLFEHNPQGQFLILVLSTGYNDSNGKCRFDSVYWEGDWPGGTIIFSSFCADHGLVAYDSGVWNTNYLEKTNREPLTEEQIQALMLFLQKEKDPE